MSNIATSEAFCYHILSMFKIIRVLVGTGLGLFIAQYLGFISIQGINYLWAALIVMGTVFVLKGLNF